jgi:FkbM family methyltransferase
LKTSFNVHFNITFFDFFKSFFIYGQRYFLAFNRYRKSYKNYFSVLKQVRNQHFPIIAILKNGKKLILKNGPEAAIHAYGSKNFQINDDELTIKNEFLPNVSLIGWKDNADLYEIYFQNHYEKIPVNSKEVLDVGSNICDSSIYFVLNGATNVIAVELLPQNCEVAQKNITLNKMNDQINIIMAGCADKKSHAYFSSSKKGMGYAIDAADDDGIKVPLLTINDLLKFSKNESRILKLDCEGCEYDVILSSSQETLRKFEYIFIEYHFGYLNLKKKLESCGFDVKKTYPSYYYHKILKKKSYIGYLYAIRC